MLASSVSQNIVLNDYKFKFLTLIFRIVCWVCALVELIVVLNFHNITLPDNVRKASADFDLGFRDWSADQYDTYLERTREKSLSLQLDELSNFTVTVFMVLSCMFDALFVVYWLDVMIYNDSQPQNRGDGDYQKADDANETPYDVDEDQRDPEPSESKSNSKSHSESKSKSKSKSDHKSDKGSDNPGEQV